jgi:hypothetical protein
MNKNLLFLGGIGLGAGLTYAFSCGGFVQNETRFMAGF